jgi:hypothetical protein
LGYRAYSILTGSSAIAPAFTESAAAPISSAHFSREVTMRADTQKIVDSIKEQFVLLRRSL